MSEDKSKSPETGESVKSEQQGDNPRKFAVSANRGRARHRIRYVETGGAMVDTGECSFCEALPEPEPSRDSEKPDENLP